MSLIELEAFQMVRKAFRLEIPKLRLERGELVAICGQNGSGKSTFLSGLAGILPYTGDYFLCGCPFSKIPDGEKYRFLSFLPQEARLNLPFSVFYTVLTGRFPLIRGRTYREKDLLATEKILQALDLLAFKDRTFQELSGGEKRRVFLARVLNRGASILLLDEPFSGIDLLHQQKIIKVLQGYVSEKKALVLAVVHDLTLALRYFDRLLLFEKGRLLADLEAREVTEEILSRLAGLTVKLVRLPESSPEALYFAV